MPSLQNVTGNLGFYQNSFTVIVLPNLTSVESSFVFANNTQLNNVTAPQLKNVGGTLAIANNTAYYDISYNAVTTIGGSVDWTGDFYLASMSNIESIHGGLNVQTTATNFTCPFTALRSNGVVQGNTFVCTGNLSTPTAGTNGTNVTANSGGSNATNSTGSTSSTTGKSGGTQIVGNTVFVLLAGVFALVAGALL